jgi:Na+-transporting NADH:ubiquinone oxidoreductase subunit C
MSNDSIGKTLTVAVLLCLVCSIIVSGAAVVLKPMQQQNKLLDKQKNILLAAGLLEEDKDISSQFSKVEKRVVNIETGEYVNAGEAETAESFDIATYDQREAKKDPAQNLILDASVDIAGLKRRAKYAEVYLVNDAQGGLQTLILPVSGYGLWSTMYGFIALENDLNTVAGLAFYDHGETPGLGGEIDNPKWKAQWLGKKIYGEDGSVKAKLKKGGVDPSVSFEKTHYVDGLSGATLTSNGVTNLIQFWMGSDGFEPYLENLAVAVLDNQPKETESERSETVSETESTVN